MFSIFEREQEVKLHSITLIDEKRSDCWQYVRKDILPADSAHERQWPFVVSADFGSVDNKEQINIRSVGKWLGKVRKKLDNSTWMNQIWERLSKSIRMKHFHCPMGKPYVPDFLNRTSFVIFRIGKIIYKNIDFCSEIRKMSFMN